MTRPDHGEDEIAQADLGKLLELARLENRQKSQSITELNNQFI